jgi:hypothetical protein
MRMIVSNPAADVKALATAFSAEQECAIIHIQVLRELLAPLNIDAIHIDPELLAQIPGSELSLTDPGHCEC